jgi:hypothetical protein
MARLKSLEETEGEITAEAHGVVGTRAKDGPDGNHDEAPAVSENEGVVSSGDDSGDSTDDDASGDESSRT